MGETVSMKEMEQLDIIELDWGFENANENLRVIKAVWKLVKHLEACK